MSEVALYGSPAADPPQRLAHGLWRRAPACCGMAAAVLLLVLVACFRAPGGVAAHAALAAAAVSLLPLTGLVWAARLRPRGNGASLPDVSDYGALSPGLLAAVALALFAGHAAIGGVVRIDSVQAADIATLLRVFDQGGPEFHAGMRTVSEAGGPLLPLFLPLLAVGMLSLLRQPRSFVFCWSTILAGLAVPVLFKVLFHRQRPYTGGSEFNSYPSGHVTTATVVAGALLLVLVPRCRTRGQRAAAVAAAAAWPALMAVSRMNLGCHYPTDVVGGILLGSAWVVGCLAAWIACYRLQVARGQEEATAQ